MKKKKTRLNDSSHEMAHFVCFWYWSVVDGDGSSSKAKDCTLDCYNLIGGRFGYDKVLARSHPPPILEQWFCGFGSPSQLCFQITHGWFPSHIGKSWIYNPPCEDSSPHRMEIWDLSWRRFPPIYNLDGRVLFGLIGPNTCFVSMI